MTHEHDDEHIDELMNAAFAGARPDAGLEDRVIHSLRAADRWRLPRPRVPAIHPLVRRAAVGVAAAVLLGTAGFVATRMDEPANRVKSASNLRQIGQTVQTYSSDSKGASDWDYLPTTPHRDGAPESPRQMAVRWAQSAATAGEPAKPVDNNYRYWSDQPQASQQGQQGQQPGGGAVVLGKPVTPMLRSLTEVANKPAAESKPKADVNVAANEELDVAGKRGTSFYGVASAGTPRPAVQTPRDSFAFKPTELQAGQSSAGVPIDHYDSALLPTDDNVNAPTPYGGVPAQRGAVDAKKAEPVVEGKDVEQEKAPTESSGVISRDIRMARADAVQQRESTIDDLERTAQRLVRDGRTKEAAGVVEQIAVLDPNNKVAQDARAPLQAQPPAPQPAEQQQQQQQAARKIIRNGEMTFEVDGYDSAVVQITKIAAEEGGFVATTQSEKLPNGKVTGSVVVRCPPERLDTLVLKLRGLGDLKNSRIAATDITKQYTDLDAQLRAARTMEERLLEIIKTGKGTVKELLEAEKQVGTWREKIERLEGEIRYYNNLVSLSTLTIALAERDVRAAALLSESEQVNMAVEAEDVEKARAEAIKAIDDAKGRIVESDLKKHDAGQFAATIVADVAPDAAGPVIDRLKQLGRVARMDVQRRQTTAEGTGAPVPGARVERKDTRLMLSVYNLANVAPRNTTSVQLAADDVEKSYRAVLAQVESAGGRVVNSQLAKPTPEQTTGTITFETPAGGADVLLDAVRGAGEVMRLDTSTNPDTQNVTDAKRGFTVSVRSLASVPPRETTSLRVAAADVPGAFSKLREAARAAGGTVRTSQLADQQDSRQATGQLDVELKRDAVANVQQALSEAGVTIAREVGRSNDVENTTDAKVMLRVTLVDERTVPARETVTLQLAVDDVADKYEKLLTAVREAGARVVVSQIDQKDPQNTAASLEVDVRRDHRAAVDKALADAGGVFGRAVSRPAEGQAVLEDKVRLSVTLHDADNLAPREQTTMGVETSDVAKAAGDIEATAVALGGRKVDSDWAQQPSGQTIARVVVDVPLARSAELIAKARDAGTVLSLQRDQTPNAPEGPFARARVSVTVATADAIVERNQGLGASIRAGLSTSVEWLLKSVTLIVVGVCLVAPWALVVWVGWKLLKRRKARPAEAAPSSSGMAGPQSSGAA